MAIRFSTRTVLPIGFSGDVCPVPIRIIESQTVGIAVSDCCVRKITPCIVQGAAKSFLFQDGTSEDYSGIAEITVDVWRNNINGASLYSGSLTGGEVTLVNDYSFRIDISNATSDSFPAGSHHIETWATLPDGRRRILGIGRFKVIDSRKHD